MRAKPRRTTSDRDYLQIDLINRFISDLELSYQEQSRLLDLSPERTAEILKRQDKRLSLAERLRIRTADGLLRNGLLLMLDWKSLCTWFRGPFPHSKYRGATPLEQIQLGGFSVLVSMATCLELGVIHRAMGFPIPVPPPMYFDLIYRR